MFKSNIGEDNKTDIDIYTLSYGHTKREASFLSNLHRNPGKFLILYSGNRPWLNTMCFILSATHPWTRREYQRLGLDQNLFALWW